MGLGQLLTLTMNPLYLPYNRWMATVKACSSVMTISAFEDKHKPGTSAVPNLPAARVGTLLVTGTGTTYGSIDSSEINGWALKPRDMYQGEVTHLLDRRAEWEGNVVPRGCFSGVLVTHHRRPYVMTESVAIRSTLPDLGYAASMAEAAKYEKNGGGGGCWRSDLGMPVDMFMFNGYVVSRFYWARRQEYSLRTYWRERGKTSHLHIRDLDALWERTVQHGSPFRKTTACPQTAVQLALF